MRCSMFPVMGLIVACFAHFIKLVNSQITDDTSGLVSFLGLCVRAPAHHSLTSYHLFIAICAQCMTL